MNKIRILLTMAISLYGSSSIAYTCVGPVSGVTTGPTGVVAVKSLGGLENRPALMDQSFCNLNATQNGVEPNACKAIYATLLSAQLTGKNVRIQFVDISNEDCSSTSHPAWTFLKNWNWGPTIE